MTGPLRARQPYEQLFTVWMAKLTRDLDEFERVTWPVDPRVAPRTVQALAAYAAWRLQVGELRLRLSELHAALRALPLNEDGRAVE